MGSKKHQTMIKMIKVLFVICFVLSAFSAPPHPMGLKIENVNVDNQSASMKCSWGPDPEFVPFLNQTWFVDNAPADAGNVTTDTDTSSSVITLVWDTMEKGAGDSLTISCRGETVYDHTFYAYAVNETITVPGN